MNLIRTLHIARTTRRHRARTKATISKERSGEDTDARTTLDTPDEPALRRRGTIELWEDTNNDGVIGPEDNLIGTTTTDERGLQLEGLPPATTWRT